MTYFEDYMEKDIDGYPNYTIDTDGDVYNKKKKRFLKTTKHERGYHCIQLSKNGKWKTIYIHRLVALSFLPNPNGLPQVNHIDEDKTNNNVGNLEWCDNAHNMIHRKLKKNNKSGEVNIYTSYYNGKCYWIINIARGGNVVFNKYLLKTRYTLQDAVQVRNDFFKTHDYDYYRKIVEPQ